MSEARLAVVIGASSGIGRAVAERLADARYDLIVSARDEVDLKAVASDLELRYPVSVIPIALDLAGTDQELEAYVQACTAGPGRIGAALFVAGSVDDADDGTSWERSSALVTTNFLAIMKLAGRFLTLFEGQDEGTIVLFSSIAAAAPRRRNVAYAAAKQALESYGRSMQHRLVGSAVKVQIYRLGYVDTALSRGQKLLLPVVAPARVAEEVVRHLTEEHRFTHYPPYWAVGVLVLRLLPWFVYKRLTF